MRRSTYFQRLVIFGLSGPIVALNIWLLSQAFRYFEHLITVLTVAAILAFLLNYRFSFYANHSGSGSHYRFARQFNALVFVGLILVPLVTDKRFNC